MALVKDNNIENFKLSPKGMKYMCA